MESGANSALRSRPVSGVWLPPQTSAKFRAEASGLRRLRQRRGYEMLGRLGPARRHIILRETSNEALKTAEWRENCVGSVGSTVFSFFLSLGPPCIPARLQKTALFDPAPHLRCGRTVQSESDSLDLGRFRKDSTKCSEEDPGKPKAHGTIPGPSTFLV